MSCHYYKQNTMTVTNLYWNNTRNLLELPIFLCVYSKFFHANKTITSTVCNFAEVVVFEAIYAHGHLQQLRKTLWQTSAKEKKNRLAPIRYSRKLAGAPRWIKYNFSIIQPPDWIWDNQTKRDLFYNKPGKYRYISNNLEMKQRNTRPRQIQSKQKTPHAE